MAIRGGNLVTWGAPQGNKRKGLQVEPTQLANLDKLR